MWRLVAGLAVLGVSKDWSALIFMLKQSKKNYISATRDTSASPAHE